MKRLYAAVIGAAVLAGSQFAAAPADAQRFCFTFCERYVITQVCHWVPTPPHLVCTWQRICVKWRTICLREPIEIEKLPHVLPPPPPPDPFKDLFRLPKQSPMKK